MVYSVLRGDWCSQRAAPLGRLSRLLGQLLLTSGRQRRPGEAKADLPVRQAFSR